MLKRLLILAVFVFPLVTAGARAQSPIRLAKLEVAIWPEYDRPGVLVIYHLRLAEGVSLPASVVVRIPAAAGEPSAVAVRQMDGSLLNAVYTREAAGDWAVIKITATMPDLQLEYYDPQIEVDAEGTRRFVYTWPGDFPVDAMRIVIQQPLGASQMRVEPDSGSALQYSGDPMQYYQMEIGSPRVGESVRVVLTYFKDSDILSIERMAVQPGGPIVEDTRTAGGWVAVLPWVVGGLGLLLFAGGGVLYWQSRRAEMPPAVSPRGHRLRAAIQSPEQVGANRVGDAIYCHQCGKRAADGDRFCRACGAKLRRG